MTRRLNISEARARLPELAKRVVSRPGAVEYIEHRDLDDDLALTSANHIRYLEATVKELKKQISAPFVLAGSMASDASDQEIEAALDAIRTEETAGSEGKVRDIIE